jgi:hypothetical protein
MRLYFPIFITGFLLFLLILSGCNDHDTIIPGYGDGVISKRKMVDLLVDINLAESALRVGNVQHTQNSDSTYQKSLFLEVYKKHNITPDEFNSSLDYYSKHVDDMNEIFNDVIDKLNSMQAELQGADKGDLKIKDRKWPQAGKEGTKK